MKKVLQNCAGYALGIKKWVEFEENFAAEKVIKELTKKYGLERIESLEQAPKDATVILFRYGKQGYWEDFHFVKYNLKTKRAYHKPGLSKVKQMAMKKVFEPWVRRDNRVYNGEIYMFIKNS